VNTYVALLRGINVGGNGVLPMKELVAILESLGATGVKTYIQSGNAVFQHKAAEGTKLAKKLTSAIDKTRGFAPQVVVLESRKFAKIARANPFPEAEAEPKSLHVWFLSAKASEADVAALTKLKTKTEQFQLTSAALYLHAPDGIGRSKLAANVERHLGVAATARNWRTVKSLIAIAALYG